MQKELSQEFDQLDIQLLGVNHTGHEIGNENFTDGVDLPWLGDLDANEDGVEDGSKPVICVSEGAQKIAVSRGNLKFTIY